MGLTVEDLKPKPFTIKIKEVELECKPLRLYHALVVSKIGNVFQDKDATKEQFKQAQADMDEVIGELIPELKEVQLDVGSTLKLISQMMENISPADNKELKKHGVKFDTDPKVPRTG